MQDKSNPASPAAQPEGSVQQGQSFLLLVPNSPFTSPFLLLKLSLLIRKLKSAGGVDKVLSAPRWLLECFRCLALTLSGELAVQY